VKTLLAALLLALTIGAARADDVVLAAQTRLARLGYYDGKADGAWGKNTSLAVQRFQAAKKIRVTGELNPATLNALGIKVPEQPVSRGVALADLFVGGPYLTAPPEFQVQTVKKAQQNLRLLGFYNGPANGVPTTALSDALRTYQKDNRFKTTGRLDKTTLQALDLLTLAPGDY
jgi:peptidoglycan hydrolase-like protein with peptidoglycan-binding domain